MNELTKFRESANEHNVCAEYSKLWDKCETKKQLFDLALCSGAMFYFCQSYAEGWGLSLGYIASKFRPFINGRYISEQKGYDSEMYVAYNEDVTIRATNTVFLDCDCTINIGTNMICNLIVVNGNVHINGKGICYVHHYGNCNITHSENIKYHENGV